MQFKLVYVFVLSLILQGCLAPSTTITKLRRFVRPHPQLTVFDRSPYGERAASLGEDLFLLTRYKDDLSDRVNFAAPTGRPFPISATWLGTHVFNDGRSGDLIVYSTPQYYSGQFGVILDSRGRLATERSVVQVSGVRMGRSYRINGAGLFFRGDERWGLRYGGVDNHKYIFEIYDKSEASTVEIIQSLRITEEDFLNGFTVRGVLVRGIERDRSGVIRFVIDDKPTSKSR